jgi:hypothetical protein
MLTWVNDSSTACTEHHNLRPSPNSPRATGRIPERPGLDASPLGRLDIEEGAISQDVRALEVASPTEHEQRLIESDERELAASTERRTVHLGYSGRQWFRNKTRRRHGANRSNECE